MATAFCNQGTAWLREHRTESRKTEKSATYLAVRLALSLEEFAIACAQNIADQHMFETSGGHAGSEHGKLPELAPYPDSDGWVDLQPTFLARAMTLRNELKLAERLIDFWFEVDDDCIPGACKEQSGKCGLLALQLAAEMRAYYGMGAFDPHKTSWDIRGTLRPYSEEALQRAAKLAESRLNLN